MFVTFRQKLEVRYMNELFEPQHQICLVVPGRFDMKREIEVRPMFTRPWLTFPELSTSQKTGFSEKELRLLHALWQIDIEDTPQDQLEFLLGFSNAIDRWSAFEIIGQPLPPFTRRQLNKIDIEGQAEFLTKERDLTLRFFLETCADPGRLLLEMTPLEQYRVIGALGLENDLEPHSEAEIRTLLGLTENDPAKTKV